MFWLVVFFIIYLNFISNEINSRLTHIIYCIPTIKEARRKNVVKKVETRQTKHFGGELYYYFEGLSAIAVNF